jgi:hypothetical protein
VTLETVAHQRQLLYDLVSSIPRRLLPSEAPNGQVWRSRPPLQLDPLTSARSGLYRALKCPSLCLQQASSGPRRVYPASETRPPCSPPSQCRLSDACPCCWRPSWVFPGHPTGSQRSRSRRSPCKSKVRLCRPAPKQSVRRVLDEQGHLLGRDALGGNDQVALVLPRFIIQHDQEATLPEVLQRRLNRIKHVLSRRDPVGGHRFKSSAEAERSDRWISART